MDDGDGFAFFMGWLFGIVLGIFGILFFLDVQDNTPADVKEDVCVNLFDDAEYNRGINGCIKDDEIVHRFNEED